MPFQRVYDFGYGAVVINEYPEIVDELPDLLAEMGTVRTVGIGVPTYVTCEIDLHTPAKVMRHADAWDTVLQRLYVGGDQCQHMYQRMYHWPIADFRVSQAQQPKQRPTPHCA